MTQHHEPSDHDPDDLPPSTLEDAYMLGDETTRAEIKCLMDGLSALYETQADRELLGVIRKGGHRVSVVEGARQVQIKVFRTGPAYGLWTLTCSPEGHQVRIEQNLPLLYWDTGDFRVTEPYKAWTCAAAAWRSDAVALIEDLVGKKIAREAAPLLRLPEEIAPDAR